MVINIRGKPLIPDRTRLIIPSVLFYKKMNDSIVIENNTKAHKKSYLLAKIIGITLGLLIIAGLSIGGVFLYNKLESNKVTIKSIKKAWSQNDYSLVYQQAKYFLEKNPYNNTALTYYAYASFYLAQAQTDTQQAQSYLDECINNLRIALYDASDSLKPQLYYVLGKSYFYKNTITTYYYSDLAVKYLLMAKENGYEADDIAEYLGLSYAALGKTMESISAFTEALLVRESDTLLLAIAEQYYNAKELSAAEQYLFRIIRNSQNEELILKSLYLLGSIYIDQEKYDQAMEEFNKVLTKNENSADAHYGIGVIYEKEGNIVKARAEWRTALRLQVNHPLALQKINNY